MSQQYFISYVLQYMDVSGVISIVILSSICYIVW